MAIFLSQFGVNQTTWIADQFLAPNWPRVSMNGPVFIIGHQRSGTTSLHRILARDPNSLALNLRQMLLPAITAQRLWEAIVRPGNALCNWLDRFQDRKLAELDPIHRVRLDSIEEDEFLFLSVYRSGMAVNSSPSIAADPGLNRLRDYGSWSEAERRIALEWYRACLLKAVYRAEAKTSNPARWIVGKNPAFSQRIPDLLRVFPDARFIHLIRDPMQTVPSRLSLVRAVWKLRLPEIKEMSASEVEAIVVDSERSYLLAKKDLDGLPPEAAISIRFNEWAANPADVLARIYRQLQLPGDPPALPDLGARRVDVVGDKHAYSLDEFGLTEADLRARFAPILEAYDL